MYTECTWLLPHARTHARTFYRLDVNYCHFSHLRNTTVITDSIPLKMMSQTGFPPVCELPLSTLHASGGKNLGASTTGNDLKDLEKNYDKGEVSSHNPAVFPSLCHMTLITGQMEGRELQNIYS